MMAMILPFWEGISPIDFSLPESFSLSVFSTPQRWRCLSLMSPLTCFQGWQYTQGGDGSSGPGWPHHRAAWPGVGLRHQVVSPPCCSFLLLLLATFVFWYYMNSEYFSRIVDLQKIWCLDGPFSSRILTLPVSSPMIIKHVKTEETT
jgi:hypothetical protein